MTTNSFKIAFSYGVLQYLFVSGLGVRVPAKIASFLTVFGQKTTEGKKEREEGKNETPQQFHASRGDYYYYYCYYY